MAAVLSSVGMLAVRSSFAVLTVALVLSLVGSVLRAMRLLGFRTGGGCEREAERHQAS